MIYFCGISFMIVICTKTTKRCNNAHGIYGSYFRISGSHLSGLKEWKCDKWITFSLKLLSKVCNFAFNISTISHTKLLPFKLLLRYIKLRESTIRHSNVKKVTFTAYIKIWFIINLKPLKSKISQKVFLHYKTWFGNA